MAKEPAPPTVLPAEFAQSLQTLSVDQLEEAVKYAETLAAHRERQRRPAEANEEPEDRDAEERPTDVQQVHRSRSKRSTTIDTATGNGETEKKSNRSTSVQSHPRSEPTIDCRKPCNDAALIPAANAMEIGRASNVSCQRYPENSTVLKLLQPRRTRDS